MPISELSCYIILTQLNTMFDDTIAIKTVADRPAVMADGFTTSVTFARRTPKGVRAQFVPVGDIPVTERKLEIAHEQTASKRVNTLVKVSKQRDASGVNLGEASAQFKLVRPGTATLAETILLITTLCGFLLAEGAIEELYNQGQ